MALSELHATHLEVAASPHEHPPTIAEVAHLKPRNLFGFFYLGLASALTTLAIVLSLSSNVLIWFVGQLLLSIALLQWFVIIHEAGHKTLFRTIVLNKYVGHLASFFAMIPYECWKMVHGMHHHWTGWQDLDVTTSALVPRQLSRFEACVVNMCWKLWIPLFSIFYRTNNYWNIVRLNQLFPRQPARKRITWNILLLLLVYALTIFLVGPILVTRLAGLGILLTLVLQDPLILSQHTHVAMNVSHGEPVQPFAPVQQEVFTRSLRFPRWFSLLILINLDAHELHHMYSAVPGYYLSRINYIPHHTVHWWHWLRKAKRIRGELFLFQNSHHTGFDI